MSCAPSRPAGAASVWKTLGEDPPIVNVASRYGALALTRRQRMIGFNNIELITDRPLEVNLREIKQVKRDWPDRALIVSLMVPCEEQPWKQILPQVEETGADGVELNFGCPHGMCERGMGSAVGQVPDYVEMVTRWCKQHTPHAGDREAHAQRHRHPGPGARGASRAAPTRVSLINTINSIIARRSRPAWRRSPTVDGKGTHGGYCGPAVKPIALAHGGRDRARSARRTGCRSPASAASPPGATRPSSWRSAPARCRSAPRRCTTASRSSRT